jgi:hypothetical protein
VFCLACLFNFEKVKCLYVDYATLYCCPAVSLPWMLLTPHFTYFISVT